MIVAPPLLVLISGPSGVGKDAVLATLRQRGIAAHFAVTATTRPPRPGERDGIDYYFYDEARFRRALEEGELLEHASVYGRYYGVPRAPIVEALEGGQDVLMRVDVQGAATIRAMVPDAVTVFLLPASLEELAARLRSRGNNETDDLRKRMETVRAEMDRLSEFDYAVPNAEGRLEDAADTVVAIMQAERCRTGRAAPTIH